MNDFLEIGFWRQRHPRVQRVLELAERLSLASEADAAEVERELAAAVQAVRRFDAEEWPFAARRGVASSNVSAPV